MIKIAQLDYLLDDFLNIDLREQLKYTNLKTYENIYTKLNQEYNKENNISKLMIDKYKNSYNLNEFYLFCILDNKLCVAQYSHNYILDEIIFLANFFKTHDLNKFKRNLRKVYKIDEKSKYKYINKSKKLGKETIYNNYDIGCDILEYIYDNKYMNLLGDRFGLENQVLSKLTDSDNINTKLIIIINFDADFVELFESIPYELMQKGTADLQSQGIDSCYIKNFESYTFHDVLLKEE